MWAEEANERQEVVRTWLDMSNMAWDLQAMDGVGFESKRGLCMPMWGHFSGPFP